MSSVTLDRNIWSTPEETAAENGSTIARLTRMSDVEPEDVSWLWPGRIPQGKLSIICGDPATGKSFMSMDLACRLTRGKPFPDCQEVTVAPSSVVLLTAEDALNDTVRPRIDALGGDPDRIVALTGVKRPDTTEDSWFSLVRDLPALEDAIVQTGAKLCIVDPLSAYLGGTDSHRDSELRAVLGPLSDLAERRRVCILGIMHLNKSASRAAVYRLNGSIAFVAAARACWAVATDPDDPKRRIVAAVKMNLAEPAPPLAFRIVDGVVAWDSEPVTIDIDKLLGQRDSPDEADARTDAAEFLREVLGDGELPAAAVLKQTRANGYGDKMIRKAFKTLGCTRRRAGFGAGGTVHWRLPDSIDGIDGIVSETGNKGINATYGAETVPQHTPDAKDERAIEWSRGESDRE